MVWNLEQIFIWGEVLRARLSGWNRFTEVQCHLAFHVLSCSHALSFMTCGPVEHDLASSGKHSFMEYWKCLSINHTQDCKLLFLLTRKSSWLFSHIVFTASVSLFFWKQKCFDPRIHFGGYFMSPTGCVVLLYFYVLGGLCVITFNGLRAIATECSLFNTDTITSGWLVGTFCLFRSK